ncbi:DeoR/GlpR family DNA-binding transcription regulator [Oerskovia flava]|uniref:DeoR/GlpR family DNA-binding transcription regulator n=1 Tax=Oerskovia flava TaxID=2986422 RepID=UPI00223EACFA|nr:DeoR/GlpR family DNA-binding transcription regulator [Oerskovia sp. JB1-3-2]
MTSTAATDATGQARRLPAGRKAELAAYVAEIGQVTVAELAERFDVSPDTIRRDLDQLDTDGILIRTHGGAVSLSAVPRPDTGLDVRVRLQAAAKEKIGEIAAGLVTDGSSIMTNAGTTTLALARHLREHRELTIATNSLRLPAEISPKVFRDLYVFGGQVRLSAQATVGPVSFQLAPAAGDVDIRCDLALVAVGAVHAESGFSTSNLGEAAMMAQMMERASRVAVLADHSKFGRRLFAQISDLSRADYLVTDSAPPADLARALEAAGVTVLTPAAGD